MFGRAIACTVFIFALLIGSFFLLPADEPYKEIVLTNVAITLVDVHGDGRNIGSGAVSLECLASKDDTITDQFDMLKQKIHNNPGATQYMNGVYVTLAANGRRPVFQIRYPSPAYCPTFVETYKACYAARPKKDEEPAEELMAGVSHCIKQGADALHVTEKWAGMIEFYSKK